MAQHLTNMRTNVRHFDPDAEQMRIHFDATEDGFATLVVFNPQGGWILSLGEIRIRAGANTLIWHGHDGDGWPLGEGQYSLELFGFGLDRRPTGDAPLRLQVAIARRYAVGARYVSAALHAPAWLPDAVASGRP